MPGSLSPTPSPTPSDDGASRGSKELSPTQNSQALTGSAPPSPVLPPTRAELEGYSHLVGSLALRDATSLGPALLGAPLWSPTPQPSDGGMSPDRAPSIRAGPGIIPTPRTADRNERRQALRREREAFRAALPEHLRRRGSTSTASGTTTHSRRGFSTLWPEYPEKETEETLVDAVQDTATDMVMREQKRLARIREPLLPTVVKPRNKKGRFIPASEVQDEDIDELDSDPPSDHDDDELSPEIAQVIAANVQAQVDRTLAAVAACRPPGTDKARENMEPLDWRAVLAAAALTVDPE